MRRMVLLAVLLMVSGTGWMWGAEGNSAPQLRNKRLGQNPMILWYPQPAKAWVAALPVGNGRLGAMVFGGPDQERLQFNEETLWLGGPGGDLPGAVWGKSPNPRIQGRRETGLEVGITGRFIEP